MQLLTKCVGCDKKFIVSNSDIKKVVAVDSNAIKETTYTLTYYICPHCNKRHYVQADNETTEQLLVKVNRDYIQYAVAKKKGKKKNGINQRNAYALNKERQKLEEILNGTELTIDGKVEKVVFVHGNQTVYSL